MEFHLRLGGGRAAASFRGLKPSPKPQPGYVPDADGASKYCPPTDAVGALRNTPVTQPVIQGVCTQGPIETTQAVRLPSNMTDVPSDTLPYVRQNSAGGGGAV